MTDADIRKIADECAAAAGVEVTDFRKQGRTNPSAPFVAQFWREGTPPVSVLIPNAASADEVKSIITARLGLIFKREQPDAA